MKRRDPVVPIGSVWIPPNCERYYLVTTRYSGGPNGRPFGTTLNKVPPAGVVVVSRLWFARAWILLLVVNSELLWEWELDVNLWKRVG